jgi:hypothetical protein
VTGTERPVFLPHIGAQDETPALRAARETAESYETPIPESQYGVAPRALTRPILAARQTAEQYGADFAQRAERAGAVGAAQQVAEHYEPVPRAGLLGLRRKWTSY